jgi:hypothetical protein
MDCFNDLMKTTFNMLGKEEQETIITGLKEHKRFIFKFSKKHYAFIHMEEKVEQMYTIQCCSVTSIHLNPFMNMYCALDDKFSQPVDTIKELLHKMEKDFIDVYYLQLYYGDSLVGIVTFIGNPSKSILVNCIHIKELHYKNEVLLWLWSILEDMSFLYHGMRRKPVLISFMDEECYTDWGDVLNMYYAVRNDTTMVLADWPSNGTEVVVSLSILVGVIYPRRHFRYTQNFKDLQLFTSLNLNIDCDGTLHHLKQASYLANILLHGNNNVQNWVDYVPKIWVKEDEHVAGVNMLNRFIHNVQQSFPITITALPNNVFVSINNIFHKGSTTEESIRRFFSLFYNALAKSPRKFFEDKESKCYKSFFKCIIVLKEKTKNIDYKKLTKELSKLSKKYLDFNYEGEVSDILFYATLFQFTVCTLIPEQGKGAVTVIEKKDKTIITDNIANYGIKSYLQWKLRQELHPISQGHYMLLLYKFERQLYYLNMEEEIEHCHMGVFAMPLYNKRLQLFHDIQKYVSSISYRFHELFEENHTPVNIITSSNFEELVYPYNDWMKQPVKFEAIVNGMVSPTFCKKWLVKETAIEYMRQLQQYFHHHNKIIEIIDVHTMEIMPKKFSFNELVNYFKSSEHEEIFNQVSCEISLSKLRKTLITPQFVQELDLIDIAWNIDNKPNVQCHLLTSVKNCYMDFQRISSVVSCCYWKKIFCLITPTENNLKAFVFWKENNINASLLIVVIKILYHFLR